MPYIANNRKLFDKHLNELRNRIDNDGELTYCIYKLCLMYAQDKGICYSTYKDIIGILECAKLEFYRQKVAPYESDKLKSFGDIIV